MMYLKVYLNTLAEVNNCFTFYAFFGSLVWLLMCMCANLIYKTINEADAGKIKSRSRERETIEMCSVYVTIPYSEYNHYVLRTCINKSKII